MLTRVKSNFAPRDERLTWLSLDYRDILLALVISVFCDNLDYFDDAENIDRVSSSRDSLSSELVSDGLRTVELCDLLVAEKDVDVSASLPLRL